MSRRSIEGNYAKLTGLHRALVTEIHDFIFRDFAEDYIAILKDLRKECDDEFSGFELPEHVWREHDDPAYQVNKPPLRSKIMQLISYLESVHAASNKIVEIGSVYNLIKDEELKSRCSDLLSATDHFDRVINQATQVLEERLRKKLPDLDSLHGAALVGKAMHKDPDQSRIRFSDSGNEQEGYTALFRGIVGAFRNTSHHKFMTNVTREQALQICAFIDNLLAALETAEILPK
ncbi:hypothetical protein MNBD_ALPHA08-1548 [hydrothermal vent metagenome]|uniref:Conserved hypothetical protein CHP02391 domain-containing protein n=1 Tax=hydrothermal vent metagenome TaxID=652676 RepID=A0A3B0S4V6_9ZZZZ